jgi:hypothetical protein
MLTKQDIEDSISRIRFNLEDSKRRVEAGTMTAAYYARVKKDATRRLTELNGEKQMLAKRK